MYNTILVIVDRFSKINLYIPTTKKVTSEGLATIILNEVVKRFSIPNGIISDRGTIFTS